jgi:hypothetical protein
LLCQPPKAAPEKIRHFDEEGLPIAAASRLELSRERKAIFRLAGFDSKDRLG